jgi:hypothetical protein
MLPRHDSPLTIVGACAIVWFVIWWSAEHPTRRNWTIGITALFALLGSCRAGIWYFQRVHNERWCSQGFVPCQSAPVELRSWMPLVISLGIVGYVTFQMNTQQAQSWSQAIFEHRTQAPKFLYVIALILRMQLVILGFVGMAVLFWSGDPDSGRSLLTILLLFLIVSAPFPIPILRVVLSFKQLGKCQQACGLVYGITPTIYLIVMLWNQNSTHLLNVFHRPGGDSRYLALVVVFFPLSAYMVLGELLAEKLHTNLKSLDYLTASRTREVQIDPGPTLSELRRIKRSAHAVAVITAGIAIGCVPPALHLPDILGMIVGVGFVAFISYLDAELASRHLK